MSFTNEQIQKIAKLARIELNEQEVIGFTAQLEEIFTYIEKLSQLDTHDVAPSSHVLGLENVFRQDRCMPSFSNAQALENALEQENGYFKTPKII